MEKRFIREAIEKDFNQIQSIYRYYVLHDTATAEIEVPSEQEMIQRWEHIIDNHFPYLVAVENDQIIGYAYLAPYSERGAFKHTAVLSIYIHSDLKAQGLGSQLLKALEERVVQLNLKKVLASISGNNSGSLKFHQRHQFKKVGSFPRVMFKFDQWIDLIWLIKEYE